MRRTLLTLGIAVALSGMAAPTAGATGGYTITDLGALGGDASEAHALNSTGAVVGIANDANGVSRAFEYNNGTSVLLPGLGGGYGYS